MPVVYRTREEEDPERSNGIQWRRALKVVPDPLDRSTHTLTLIAKKYFYPSEFFRRPERWDYELLSSGLQRNLIVMIFAHADSQMRLNPFTPFDVRLAPWNRNVLAARMPREFMDIYFNRTVGGPTVRARQVVPEQRSACTKQEWNPELDPVLSDCDSVDNEHFIDYPLGPVKTYRRSMHR